MEPTMDQFMHHYANQASQRSFSGDQSRHRVFHSSVTTLYHRELLVRVFAKMLTEVLQCCWSIFFKLFPNVLGLRPFDVQMMDGNTIVHFDLVMRVLGICSPHKVMHLGGIKMPSQFLSLR